MKIQPIVIGSSGWLSRACLEYLQTRRDAFLTPLVFGSGRNAKADVYPLADACNVVERFNQKNRSIIFHFAYLTQEKTAGLSQPEYIETINAINNSVLSLMAKISVSHLIYASSGAVRLAQGKIDDKDSGKVLYGKLKLRDEQTFQKLCRQNGITCIVPRIFNLAGRHINKTHSYAISNMLLQAENFRRIIIEANQPVIRSYCDVFDLMQLLGSLAINEHVDRSTHLFDVGGEEVVELTELGERIAKMFPAKVEVIRSYSNFHEKSEDRYVADNLVFSQLCNDLDIRPANLETCIANTKDFLATQQHFSKSNFEHVGGQP